MKSAQTSIFGVTISVDDNEWYYGRPENRNNKVLIKDLVSENEIVSTIHAREINEYFKWTESHEKDTLKKRKRPLYVDAGFFIKNRV